MAVLIGGSGSTGSSLLRQVVNRHPDAYCGPETYLFAQAKLYANFKKNKKYILKKHVYGLKTAGWFMQNGVFLDDLDFGWPEAELEKLVNDCDSFPEFGDRFFKRALDRTGSNIWFEKSPSNACHFHHFLKQFENSKVVHTLRDPYDTIASLVLRGFTPYFATGLYLYNAAMAAASRESADYFEIRYEDIVSDPEVTLKGLFNFLNLPYNSKVLEVDGKGSKMGAWRYNPTEKINRSSNRRFDDLDEVDKAGVIRAADRIRFHKRYQRRRGIPFADIRQLCEAFDYPYMEPKDLIVIRRFGLTRIADMSKRTLKSYPTHFLNYPFVLKSRSEK
ncbi:MAG: sulfotransferase [Bacteroidota bacterium]